jgi:DNA invertase Pin-like site-specific DNA recombinase
MQTERDNNVLELLQDNIPAKTIAKIFNIDKATVYRIAKKYNFKLS